MSALELKEAIIAAFPPGASERIDWEGSPGQHMEAMANVIQDTLKKQATRFFVDTAGQFTWVEKYAEPVSDLAVAVGLWNERRAKERYASNPETLELCLAYLRSEAVQKRNADFAKDLLEDYHRFSAS